jgi:hypothetical protein
MIEHYDNKFNYLYMHQKGLCIGCMERLMNGDKIDFQHRARKTKWRLRKFPLFINSLLNGGLIHNLCNTTKHMSAGQISDYNAERYEKFLMRHPKISNFVNTGLYIRKCLITAGCLLVLYTELIGLMSMPGVEL